MEVVSGERVRGRGWGEECVEIVSGGRGRGGRGGGGDWGYLERVWRE